jgi:hypothetical protein
LLMSDQSAQNRQLLQLLDFPREDIATEIKTWLDLSIREVRANLAKDLLALANHGGGFVIFGLEERSSGWTPAGACPFDLDNYSQDEINSIVLRHADPPFECAVFHVESSSGQVHVIVEIPGGHAVPIRSKRAPESSDLRSDTYYVRLPGPSSAPPRTGRDWDDLIRRCVNNARAEIVEELRRVLDVVRNEPDLFTAVAPVSVEMSRWVSNSRERLGQKIDEVEDRNRAREFGEAYASGAWTCAYILDPAPAIPLSPNHFRELLSEVRGHETGWPPWITIDRVADMRAYDAAGIIECWLSESNDLDFWRADPVGKLFITRRLQEDTDFAGIDPGTFFDLSLPVWRVGECLLHFERLASRVGATRARFRFEWSGLQGRTLESNANRRRNLSPGRQCRVPVVTSELEVEVSSVRDGLPELSQRILEPLFSAFEFFIPPSELFGTTASELRNSR